MRTPAPKRSPARHRTWRACSKPAPRTAPALPPAPPPFRRASSSAVRPGGRGPSWASPRRPAGPRPPMRRVLPPQRKQAPKRSPARHRTRRTCSVPAPRTAPALPPVPPLFRRASSSAVRPGGHGPFWAFPHRPAGPRPPARRALPPQRKQAPKRSPVRHRTRRACSKPAPRTAPPLPSAPPPFRRASSSAVRPGGSGPSWASRRRPAGPRPPARRALPPERGPAPQAVRRTAPDPAPPPGKSPAPAQAGLARFPPEHRSARGRPAPPCALPPYLRNGTAPPDADRRRRPAPRRTPAAGRSSDPSAWRPAAGRTPAGTRRWRAAAQPLGTRRNSGPAARSWPPRSPCPD